MHSNGFGKGLTLGARAARIRQPIEMHRESNHDYANRPEASAGVHDECRS